MSVWMPADLWLLRQSDPAEYMREIIRRSDHDTAATLVAEDATVPGTLDYAYERQPS